MPCGQPKIAKTLLLRIQSVDAAKPLNSQQLKDVDRLLKLQLRNLTFTLDSTVHFNFFNKPFILKIISWTAVGSSDDLEQSIENLHISKHSNDFFKVTNCTTIEVSSENVPNSDEESEEIPKYLFTKSDIGGLNKQLETIEEAIDFALGLRGIPHGMFKVFMNILDLGKNLRCGTTIYLQELKLHAAY